MASSCNELDIELSNINENLRGIRELINKWISATNNNNNNPRALRDYANFLQQLALDAAGEYNKAQTYSQQAAQLNCSPSLQQGFRSKMAEASQLQQNAQNGVTAATEKAKRIELEQEEAKEQLEKADTPQDPEDPATPDPKQNQANDDNPPPATPGQGQPQSVVAEPKAATTAQTGGTATSDTKSPGPVGTAKSQEKPGKRLKNPLGNFASYTYQITLYMITPDAYELFIQSGRKNINLLANSRNNDGSAGTGTGAGAYIIAQSGGINNKTSQRAPGFENDFYIDNLRIVTATNGKASLTATNTTQMSFQIIEPYGFSFITKLRNAGQALQQYSNALGYQNLSNASKQFFILGLRFQGYDINGNALTGKETLYGDPLDPQGTDNGIFEQFYDILLTKISFKLDGKAVVYNIEAAATAPQAWSFAFR